MNDDAIKRLERSLMRTILYALAPESRHRHCPPFPEPCPRGSPAVDAWYERSREWEADHDAVSRARWADAALRILDETEAGA